MTVLNLSVFNPLYIGVGSESAAIAAQWQDPAIVFEWPDLIYTAQIQLIERVFLFFI
jgi:hypothetical protein